MPKTYFITGTDTDVGKTFVSCNLLQAAKLKGLSTAAIKPIAAGGVISNEELQNEDALLLQKNCTLGLSYKEINPFCLKQAIAPHIAAQNEGVSLKASELAGHCNNIMSKKADLTLIKPTVFISVPRLYNKFYDAIMTKFSKVTGIKAFIKDTAVKTKLANSKKLKRLLNKFIRFWN